MNPKHKSPSRDDRRAQAPYNFVPLPEKVVTVECVPKQDAYQGHTGFIDCKLTSASPLYTRCAWTPEDFARWGNKAFYELPQDVQAEMSQFFGVNADGQPVIPGSSLRGLVRSLVEIAGYGKVQWVTAEQLIYRAVGDPTSLGSFYREQVLGRNKTRPPDTQLDYPSPRLKGGYLKKSGGGWAIQPAREHMGESLVHVEYTDAGVVTGGGRGRQRVYDAFVQPAGRKTTNRGQRGRGDLLLDIAITPRIEPVRPGLAPPAGLVPAKLVESGHMGGRHAKHWHCAIYEKDSAQDPIPIPEEMWHLYRADRDLTRGIKTRKLESEGDPLFYLVDGQGKVLFFGPTKMFRMPYDRSPLELVPEALRDESMLDLAEAIFGFTKSGEIPAKERARAGRVFFGDAHLKSEPEDLWLSKDPIAPKILGSPKPTSIQNYLTQQQPDDRRMLDHYASPPPHKTAIRGHKLYWHQDEVSLDDIEETDEAAVREHHRQYTRIKPLRAGVTFRFRIGFENLRDFELGALLWTLSLPGGSDKVYRHKLGMGKPLGMGAVQIEPTLFLSEREDREKGRYGRLFGKPEGEPAEKPAANWRVAEAMALDLAPFVKAFETYVLDGMDRQERRGTQSLAALPRIRVLLKMLEWPGPDPSLTEYAGVAEFRSRPVLPDPMSLPKPGDRVRPPEPERSRRPPKRKPGLGPRPGQQSRQPGGTSPGQGQAATGQRRSGSVKWFSEGKGYGFIDQGDGTDIFVHVSEIEGQPSLRDGQRVRYEVGVGRGGKPAAKKVRPE